MYTVGDLFAGMGGVALGFKQAGFNLSWANELDRQACITYRSNFKHKLFEGDIRNINLDLCEKINVLCGGFPCQAFSVAGNRKGFDDDRGNVFFEIIKIAKRSEPRVIFLENVKNLKGHNKGETFKQVQEALSEIGFKYIAESVLNTCEYSSVPQNRERVYILAFKDEQDFKNFEFPKPVTKRTSFKNLLDKDVDESFYYSNSKYYPLLKETIKSSDSIYQLRRVYVRENKNNLCPTLTANMGLGGHNVPLILDHKDIRKLTPRECARFQGFPESFIFPEDLSKSALYKQIGNSVSVPVINKIATNIFKAFELTDTSSLTKVA